MQILELLAPHLRRALLISGLSERARAPGLAGTALPPPVELASSGSGAGSGPGSVPVAHERVNGRLPDRSGPGSDHRGLRLA